MSDKQAGDILNALKQRYAACTAYSDAGDVARWDIREKRPEPQLTFKTAFVRPSKWNFTVLSDWGQTRVWTNGAKAFTRHEYSDETEQDPDIQTALGRMNGRTMGAATEVPALLTSGSEQQYWRFVSMAMSLQTLRLAAPEKVDDEICHCIVGALNGDTEVILRISEKTSCLKQVQEFTMLPPEDEPLAEKTERWSTLICYRTVSFNDALKESAFG